MSRSTTITHKGTEYSAEVVTITRTFLGVEDHGIFTASLTIEWSGAGTTLGGMCLDEPYRDADDKFLGRRGTSYGMSHIMAIMSALGVDSWEKVKGQRCFVLYPLGGHLSGFSAVGIAHLTDERKIMVFKDHYDEHEAGAA